MTVRYEQEKEELKKNMTVRFKQKKDAATVKLKQKAQEDTSQLVQKHSAQMLVLLKTKQEEIKNELQVGKPFRSELQISLPEIIQHWKNNTCQITFVT